MQFAFHVHRSLASLVITVGCCATTRAGTMLSPVAVLGTDLGVYDPQTPLENMINQSGLDKPFTSGATDFDVYFNTGAPPFGQGAFNNGWQSNFSFNLPLTGYVDFDLGAVYTIDRLGIWNRSLETGNILVKENLGDAFVDVGDFALQNKLNFPFSYQPEFVTLDSAVDARYLRLAITSTYKFDASDTFAYAIVGELVVDAITSTPFTADFDQDGDVDGADLVQWQGDFGVNADSDANNDVDSDGADFIAWQQQLGSAPITSALIAIPEPAALALAVAALGVMTQKHRRTGASRASAFKRGVSFAVA
jgi:hypothetical protein